MYIYDYAPASLISCGCRAERLARRLLEVELHLSNWKLNYLNQ